MSLKVQFSSSSMAEELFIIAFKCKEMQYIEAYVDREHYEC